MTTTSFHGPRTTARAKPTSTKIGGSEQGQQVLAVCVQSLLVLGLDASCGEERRRKVEQGDRLRQARTARRAKAARPRQHEGHAYARLVHMALAEVGGAVVRTVGDERVLAHPVPIQRGEHATHAVVEPSEARKEEARQPRLLEHLGRVEPP